MKPFAMQKSSLRLIGGATALVTTFSLVACGGGGGDSASGGFDGEVKVGILHSRSGTMAISENTVAEAELLAIDEINKAGGVKIGDKRLKIVPVEEDGASDWPTFAEKAKKLIDQDQVAVVFGGWTSASRKAMLPVFEAKDHFLFYPIQYEGQECSKNIFYSGAAPNQQAEPAVEWLLKNKGKDFFLVGSDYVYPRTANTIMKEQLKATGGKVVGEDYLPLGNTEVPDHRQDQAGPAQRRCDRQHPERRQQRGLLQADEGRRHHARQRLLDHELLDRRGGSGRDRA